MQKTRFRDPRIVPPGGRYFYEVPETKAYIEAPTRGGVITAIRAHYEVNSIPVPTNIDEMLQEFMCRRLPKGFCLGAEPTIKVVTLAKIRAKTEAMVRAGGGCVSPGEARRRAGVCGSCLKNDRTLCPTCVGLVAWGLRAVRQRPLGFEAWLGVCAVDVTAVSAKVYVNNVSHREEAPEGCWVPKEEST